MNKFLESIQSGKIIMAAHRGAKAEGLPPENTLPAFQYAIDLGSDGIETDLHQTKDGVVIMMHDHTVDRTTNGTGRICDMTFEELRNLDAGTKAGEEWKGTQVPTFEEFLDLVEPYQNLLINLELKDYPNVEGELAYDTADKVIAAVERRGMGDRIMLNCFSRPVLCYIHDRYGDRYPLHGFYPDFLMGEHTCDVYPFLTYVCLFNCRLDEEGKVDWSPKKEHELMSAEEFDRVKNELHCEPCICFGADTPERMKEAIERGVTMFTCNHPANAIQILNELGVRNRR